MPFLIPGVKSLTKLTWLNLSGNSIKVGSTRLKLLICQDPSVRKMPSLNHELKIKDYSELGVLRFRLKLVSSFDFEFE